MAKRRQIKLRAVFLDSSVLFTAVNSPFGGSAKLFTLADLRLFTSPVVLTEVERNVRKKLSSFQLERFFLLVGKMAILNQRPDKKIIMKAKKATVEKDAVILAEAKIAKIDLVTLDKKHLLTDEVVKFLKPKSVFSPKEILEGNEVEKV